MSMHGRLEDLLVDRSYAIPAIRLLKKLSAQPVWIESIDQIWGFSSEARRLARWAYVHAPRLCGVQSDRGHIADYCNAATFLRREHERAWLSGPAPILHAQGAC